MVRLSLSSLSRALDYVDKLKGAPSQADTINRIKCAALTCRHPLEEFSKKMQKFDQSFGLGKSRGKLEDAGRKVQWAFGSGKTDEIAKLRSYLSIHVGIINMQMIQQGFEGMAIVLEERGAYEEALKKSIEGSAQELRDIRGDIEAQSLLVREQRSIIRSLSWMVSGEVAAPLKALTAMVSQVLYVATVMSEYLEISHSLLSVLRS